MSVATLSVAPAVVGKPFPAIARLTMLSDPRLTITCDSPGCTYIDYVGLTVTGRGYDERNVPGELIYLGWETISENVHRCPMCVEEAKEAASEGTPDPV